MDKLNQLTKLKALLDSGALTQEEFDAAKARILADSDTLNTSHPVATSPAPRNNKKWIVLGISAAIIVVVVILVIVLSNAKKGNRYNGEFAEEFEVADSCIDVPGETFDEWDEEPSDGLTIGNPWRKGFFLNEWGEENPNKPYIYATIDGTGLDIHIDYVPPTEESRWGVFRFYLEDNDGHFTESSGPVNIIVRAANGHTEYIEITGTREGITFVEDPGSIEILKHYLDEEQVDIQMEYVKYNERHKTQGRLESTRGSFGEAINKLL